MIQIFAIGGYSEIGRNMTAIRYKNEIIICDMGLHLDNLVKIEESDESPYLREEKELIDFQILPDDRAFFKQHGHMVKAMIATHAHLDHIGGIIKMADKYHTNLYLTPFAAEVLKNIEKNENMKLETKVHKLNPGSKVKISENLEIEFIYATHSTPQTVMACIHTPEGPIIYAVDFKFDEYPTLGKRTDYERLKELGQKGVLALICDSTNVEVEKKTFSESFVKEMFKDILFWTENTDNAIFVATFSSHIARINMLVGMAREMKRKPVILGRSIKNYVSAAEKANIVEITKKAPVFSYKNEIMRALKKVERNREEYFVICTGGQGEPGSVTQRLSDEEYPFRFQSNDQFIFSCSVIPTATNQANREALEKRLKVKGVRIFKDIHQSGHVSREDIRDMMMMLKPKHFIPTHGGIQKLASAIELAHEMGMKSNKSTHLLQNGEDLTIE